MALTIKDVAEKSKVSTATVSRALRGLPNVTPSTREHVIKVAKEMGYSIDPVASQLRSKRTQNVGIVMPLADSWFYGKLSTAAEAILIHAGYYPIRYSMTGSEDQTSFFERLSARKNIEGLIISSLTLSPEDIHIIENMNIPVVTVETKTESFSSISINNFEAAKLATRYLLNLGHRQIGVIAGLSEDPLKFSVPQKRLLGYKAALKEYDIEFRPELIVPGNYSFAGGAEATIHFLSMPSPPTAIFALSDEMAIGALKTLREMNLKIPEDMSIIGFDDNDVSEFVNLSTIRQPVMQFGEKAATLLLESLASKNKVEHRHISMDTQLIVRGTTGPKVSTPLDLSSQ
jgi:DNA-binding LacI/PurR family transcriptional regulator